MIVGRRPPERRELRDRLASAPGAIGGPALRAAERGFRPGIDEWGGAEIVRHLIAVEIGVWQPRLYQMTVADDPRWTWTEPRLDEGPPDRTVATICATFARRRAETVAFLDRLDDAGWARHGTHETFGRLDVAGLIREVVNHDHEHLTELARQLMEAELQRRA